jgi:hypothetical protein
MKRSKLPTKQAKIIKDLAHRCVEMLNQGQSIPTMGVIGHRNGSIKTYVLDTDNGDRLVESFVSFDNALTENDTFYAIVSVWGKYAKDKDLIPVTVHLESPAASVVADLRVSKVANKFRVAKLDSRNHKSGHAYDVCMSLYSAMKGEVDIYERVLH